MADEVRIDALGAGGDGVAEEGTLFIPYTLPGERVRVSRHGQRGEVVSITERSTDRVAPPCPHFGRCGGCALQHGADAMIARWKENIVRTALARRGIGEVDIRPIQTSPPGARRRITLSARRTKKTTLIGFHAAASDEIVAVERCDVADLALIEAIGRLDELVRQAASRKGEAKFTLTASQRGIDCAITEAKPIGAAGLALLAGAGTRAGLARLSWNGETAVTIREPVQQMGRARVVPPPGGFLQATREGEAALAAAVAEAVGGADRVADLFAGCGTFALRLAENAEVLACEADSPALEALDRAWRAAEGLKRIDTERRDLFHRPLRTADLRRFGAVVIDPPRAGARDQSAQIAESGVPRIASVSCNPATFARDARILLDGGYRLDWVQPVDQFRWSPHVELAAQFTKG